VCKLMSLGGDLRSCPHPSNAFPPFAGMGRMRVGGFKTGFSTNHLWLQIFILNPSKAHPNPSGGFEVPYSSININNSNSSTSSDRAGIEGLHNRRRSRLPNHSTSTSSISRSVRPTSAPTVDTHRDPPARARILLGGADREPRQLNETLRVHKIKIRPLAYGKDGSI